MWPWEHLAVGYVVFSLWCRTTGRDRPLAADVVAVAVGSQFPDLVDKPLGWGTTLLPSGTSLAHSLLVAVPVAATVVALGRWVGRPTPAIGFALSYLAHLPGDVVYPVLLGGDPKLGFLLWPIVPAEPMAPTAVFGRAGELVGEFVAALSTPAGYAFLVVEALLLGTAVLLWRADGHPGLELLGRRGADRSS
jgi:hypothetical protein